MEISYHRTFKKRLKKLTSHTQNRFYERLRLFISEPTNLLLRYHELSGALAGVFSINVTGNLRAHFIYRAPRHIRFIDIGTHSELYGS